jgi:hypothetical protein
MKTGFKMNKSGGRQSIICVAAFMLYSILNMACVVCEAIYLSAIRARAWAESFTCIHFNEDSNH